MTQQRCSTRPPRFNVVLKTIAAVIMLGIAGLVNDLQAQGCGVGTRVQFEDGGRGVGTIAEIGTRSPHVGWYRIVFSWNGPNGDWYSPKDWGMFIAGTKSKCGQQPPQEKPVPQPQPSQPQPAANGSAAASAIGPNSCPMHQPPGEVTRTASASPQLFQRVIYERAAARVNPSSISAPKAVGLTFLEFRMGEPYENTLTSKRFGDKRLHTGAPVGAMIYPITTTELQCDLHGEEVRRRVSEVSHDCFKNKDGEWTCPGRTTKVVENRLIPVT